VVWWDRWSLSSFVGPGGKVVRSGSPLFWKLRSQGLDRTVRHFAASGAHVLFVATEPPGIAAGQRCADWCPLWRQFVIAHYADIGKHWNSLLEQYATDHPGIATFMSVTNVVCKTDVAPCDDRINGVPARYDGTHYTATSGPIVVNVIAREIAKLLSAPR